MTWQIKFKHFPNCIQKEIQKQHSLAISHTANQRGQRQKQAAFYSVMQLVDSITKPTNSCDDRPPGHFLFETANREVHIEMSGHYVTDKVAGEFINVRVWLGD